jgi:hypothetical protein
MFIILFCACVGVYKLSHYKISFTFGVQDWDCYLMQFLAKRTRNICPSTIYFKEKNRT